jgi:hexosaminidase
MVRDGRVFANTDYPGLEIRYTIDGTEPNEYSTSYSKPFPMAAEVRLKSFDARRRASRTVNVTGQTTVPAH